MAVTPIDLATFLTYSRANAGATYVDKDGGVSTVAPNVPRIGNRGLLIEESRVNLILNNTMVGAVAGSPGTLPTGWGGGATQVGITRQVVGVGVEDGIEYIDLRYSGTASGYEFATTLTANGQVAASAGQQWTLSAFVRLQAGSLTGVNGVALLAVWYNSTPTLVGAVEGIKAIPTGALRDSRVAHVMPAAPANTAWLQPRFDLEFQNGATIDVTLRIGLPQLELGTFATSPIKTSAGAVTRGLETALSTPIASWFNPEEGTVLFEAELLSPQSLTLNNGLWTLCDPSVTNNRIMLRRNNTAGLTVGYVIANGGSIQKTGIGSLWAQGATRRHLWSWKATEARFALGGSSTVASSAGDFLPSGIDRLFLGFEYNGAGSPARIDGYIRKFIYIPAYMPARSLEAMSAMDRFDPPPSAALPAPTQSEGPAVFAKTGKAVVLDFVNQRYWMQDWPGTPLRRRSVIPREDRAQTPWAEAFPLPEVA